MFSAFAKLISFILNDEEDVSEDNELSAQELNDEDKGFDSTDEKEGLSKSSHGKVTHIYNDYGLIDGEIFFTFQTVLSEKRLGLGEEVSYVAKRETLGSGWRATQVALTTSWDFDEDDKEDKSMVGIIEKFNGEFGTINGQIQFSVSAVTLENYVPCVGDYVTVDVMRVSGLLEASNIKPLRMFEKEGQISAVQKDHGYIDGDTFFTLAACCDGFSPRKWDRVQTVVIESAQGQCSWRAISIKPVIVNPSLSVSAFASPMKSSFLDDLQKNKNGIHVSLETDFGKVDVGEKRKLTVWVQNKGETEQVFLRAHLPPECKQINIEGVKYLSEHTAMMKSGNVEVKKGKITLYPAMSLYINLSLEAKFPGTEKQLLVVTFEKFLIGRYITAEIADPYHSLVPVGPVYKSEQQMSPFTKYRTSANAGQGWVVPGERPQRGGRKHILKLPNRLPQYPVPHLLRNFILNGDQLLEICPELTQDLSTENYVKKMKTLLHLEEIQMDIDIREFDLSRVPLRPVGEFLGLAVPGLAEGRPSVLLGDKVMLSDPSDPQGPIYEGYVHEVFSEEVLLKFNSDFHLGYNGKDYNVQFTFNRSSIRRCHQAVQFAANLDENVLFPSIVCSRPSQLKRTSSTQCLTSPAERNGQRSDRTMQFFNPRLNQKQKVAVSRILHGQSRPVPYILFGPPGTGKTMTVVESILQVLTQISHSRILACTPSNSAADLIAERLHLSGVVKTCDMIRLNASQRSQEGIAASILPYCTTGEDLDMASRYRVVVSTCITAGSLCMCGIKAGHFTHVFVDEAGQATEPECLIAVNFAAGENCQVTLAGDPMQLGPVIRSKFAKGYDLDLSFLERLVETPIYARDEAKFADHGAYDPLLVTKLVDNYRSHEAILTLTSKLFYYDELRELADRELTHSLCQWTALPRMGFPVIFHGVRGEDLREGNSPSWFNPAEVVQVVRYLQGVQQEQSVAPEDIGIITPYRKQVEKIRLLIDKLGMKRVKVGSVEEFQGQQRKVIIISTVRANERMIGFDKKHTLGFLSNPKRFNVAISRAQALLIIVGNPYVLAQDKYWQVLIQYCIENGAYCGCDIPELLPQDVSTNHIQDDNQSGESEVQT
ncbi:RNA helicase Mov10l1-like [Saccostrea cucullata]|uniref:RNA helicase Mov10l1-like n=1 Tax=Saccostrea cuccullata TaxID=36930 RepID=UPI002ED61AFF